MDEADMFKHELCAVPASMFDDNGMMKTPVKPKLAKSIAKICGIDPLENRIPSAGVKYVLDGGSLLHRIPWLVLPARILYIILLANVFTY